MEQNYRIYDLAGTLLETVDDLSHSSYGKPGMTKEHAEETGKTCYFVKVPGSPRNLRVVKEVHARLFGNSESIWCIVFNSGLSKHPMCRLVRKEEDVRPTIEALLNRLEGYIKEEDIYVDLAPIK